MLQRNLAGCMFLLAAIAISSAQSSVPAVQPQGNSQNPNIQTSPRIAPGSIPQQQPMWRPGQQTQPKPSPQVAQPQTPTNATNGARPGVANQAAVSASRTAAQPLGATVEPTTGASISWPGGVNRTPVVTASQPAATNAAMMRPVNAAMAPNSSLPTGSMPTAQPMPGSTGRAGVDYRGGLLSVVAENAELGKLMRIIGNRTGAQIDVSTDVANELVMAHLGPASPNEVLTALLDSSHLTYIMIGEDKVTKVVIRRRYGSAAPVVARHRNLGFPEPTPESQTNTQPQEEAAQSDEIKPVGEMTAPPLPSRSPALRPGSPLLPGRAQSQDANGQPENVDVRAQVNGTEAPEQPESNPPQL